MRRLTLFIYALLLLAGGCSKDYKWKNPLDPINNLPPAITDYFPEDGALVCSGGNSIGCCVLDPNKGDTLISCDFFFGETNPPPYYIQIGNGTGPSYDFGTEYAAFSIDVTIQDSLIYYWKFKVYDNHGAYFESPVYQFTGHTF